MWPTAATGVTALRDDRAAADALARTDVDPREVGIAGAEPVLVIDDDGLAEAGIDRIRSRELHDAVGGRQDVLVGERVVPAVVAVVIEVVVAAGRLRVPEGEPEAATALATAGLPVVPAMLGCIFARSVASEGS